MSFPVQTTRITLSLTHHLYTLIMMDTSIIHSTSRHRELDICDEPTRDTEKIWIIKGMFIRNDIISNSSDIPKVSSLTTLLLVRNVIIGSVRTNFASRTFGKLREILHQMLFRWYLMQWFVQYWFMRMRFYLESSSNYHLCRILQHIFYVKSANMNTLQDIREHHWLSA